MSEILTGIRVIKFYAWENNFIKKILRLRYVLGSKRVMTLSLAKRDYACSGNIGIGSMHVHVHVHACAKHVTVLVLWIIVFIATSTSIWSMLV